jgi:hypothetical protein
MLFTDSAHTDFDNEAQTLSLARHPNAKTLVRNLWHKISGTESFERSRSNMKVKKKFSQLCLQDIFLYSIRTILLFSLPECFVEGNKSVDL